MLKKLLLALSPIAFIAGCMAMPEQKTMQFPYKRWAAYYNTVMPEGGFVGFDLVVLDPDANPPLDSIKAGGTKVLAYVSLAEIAPSRDYHSQFYALPNFMIGWQSRWQSDIIDVRRAEWRRFLLQEYIPALMKAGYDGVMIDTVDTAIGYEKADPNRWAGMADASVSLIKAIRHRMGGNKLLMLNRGFDIVPHIAADIDIILAESILIDGNSHGYQRFEQSIYSRYTSELKEFSKKYPHLLIFALDYFDHFDRTHVQTVYAHHRRHGFSPYMAEFGLHELTRAQ